MPPLKRMPFVEEALAELGLNTTVQRAMHSHAPDLQIVTSQQRIDLHGDPSKRLADLKREFGPEGAQIHEKVTQAAAQHESSDAFFKAPAPLPPDGFLEKWRLG